MEAMSLLRGWCDDIASRLKKGTGEITLCRNQPLDVSITFCIEMDEGILELTQECKSLGVVLDSEIDIDIESGEMTWRAITPESFKLFVDQHGENIGYAALRNIHESPDAIHSINAAFLIGKNHLWERASALDNEIHRDKDPSLVM